MPIIKVGKRNVEWTAEGEKVPPKRSGHSDPNNWNHPDKVKERRLKGRLCAEDRLNDYTDFTTIGDWVGAANYIREEYNRLNPDECYIPGLLLLKKLRLTHPDWKDEEIVKAYHNQYYIDDEYIDFTSFYEVYNCTVNMYQEYLTVKKGGTPYDIERNIALRKLSETLIEANLERKVIRQSDKFGSFTATYYVNHAGRRVYHSFDDAPAKVYDKPNTQYGAGEIWMYKGYTHKVDGPALQMYNGAMAWYIMGQLQAYVKE